MVAFDEDAKQDFDDDSLMQRNHAIPEIAEIVHRLMQETDKRTYRFERRKEKRHRFPHLVDLIPVLENSSFDREQQLTVVGHDISGNGFRFYHTKPLTFRQAIIAVPWSKTTGLLLDLRWCRFVRNGWYESGGAFLAIVQMRAPVEP